MVKFDARQLRDHLVRIGYDSRFIDLEIISASNLHSDLQAVFEAWLVGEGKETEFEFQGVTLEDIKIQKGCDYFSALSTMSLFLKRPETIELFKKIPSFMFRRRCGGIRSEE